MSVDHLKQYTVNAFQVLVFWGNFGWYIHAILVWIFNLFIKFVSFRIAHFKMNMLMTGYQPVSASDSCLRVKSRLRRDFWFPLGRRINPQQQEIIIRSWIIPPSALPNVLGLPLVETLKHEIQIANNLKSLLQYLEINVGEKPLGSRRSTENP